MLKNVGYLALPLGILIAVGQLLKQGLDWDWTGNGLGLCNNEKTYNYLDNADMHYKIISITIVIVIKL